MIWEIATVVKHLVLPPVGLGWLLLLAFWQTRRRPRLARTALAVALLVALAMATPLSGDRLADQVRRPAPAAGFAGAQAIVVLGGGRSLVYAEDGRTVIAAHPGAFTLERVRAAAMLAKSTGLPLLITAGNPDERLPTEAAVMKKTLEEEFGIPVRWIEDRSRNTAENARFSARILSPLGVRRIILVTSGFHLRRALLEFQAAGFEPLAAPAPPVGARGEFEWRDLLPNAQTLMRSHYALHELVGSGYAAWRAAATPSATVGN